MVQISETDVSPPQPFAMKIFGKSKAKASPVKGRDAVAPELDQPGFYKCYYLGSVEVDVPTREASERAFATILFVQNQ